MRIFLKVFFAFAPFGEPVAGAPEGGFSCSLSLDFRKRIPSPPLQICLDKLFPLMFMRLAQEGRSLFVPLCDELELIGLRMLHAVHMFQCRVDWLLMHGRYHFIPIRFKGSNVVVLAYNRSPKVQYAFTFATYSEVIVDQPVNLTPGEISTFALTCRDGSFKVSCEVSETAGKLGIKSLEVWQSLERNKCRSLKLVQTLRNLNFSNPFHCCSGEG